MIVVACPLLRLLRVSRFVPVVRTLRLVRLAAMLGEGLRAHIRTFGRGTVRLANGEVEAEARRRLMLAFNAPFFPEILIASSVLAEGVDLHLDCRFVVHHDLCWNPSTLEQRTGRVDRIGAKAERARKPICIYLPFVTATQDEKMFRAVRDRERWSSVVMRERYLTDEQATDKLAERVPSPELAARALAFDLAVSHDLGRQETVHR